MKKIAIGLDIGRKYIKMVRLGLKGKEVELLDFESSEIPHSFQSYDVSDVVAKMFSNKKINLRSPACLSLSAEDSFFEIFRLSSNQRRNFKTLIYNELRNNVAFSFDDCIWDYCNLEAESKATRDSILLATARKEGLHQRLAFIQETGCVPKLINLDILAAYNCLKFNHKLSQEKLYALLNISSSKTQVLIFTLGGEFWIRSIPFGGQMFFLRIASQRGLTPQETQEFIKNLHLQKEEQSQMKELLWPLIEEYTVLLKKSFEEYYFQSSNAATRNEITHAVDEIWISGGGSLFKGIDELLYSNLRIPVKRIDSFKRIIIRENNHILTKDSMAMKASMFATAVGLALQGLQHADIRIDFIKTSAIENIKRIIKRMPRRKIVRIVVFIIIAAMIMLGVWKLNMLFTKENYLGKKVIAVKEYINGKILKRTKEREELKRWMSTTQDTSRNLLTTQNTFSQLFLRISKDLPPGIYIANATANFDYNKGKAEVILNGKAPDNKSIQILIGQFQDTYWFTAIEPSLLDAGFSIRLEIDLEE